MVFMWLLPDAIIAQDTFEDRFTLPFYNLNNGSMNFSGPWTENGEGTSPTSGRIQISGGQLLITDMDGVSIQRSLDLSGASSATLTLDYTEINGNERIAVELFDGSSWNTRAILDGSGSVNYTLTAAERNANAAIRFSSDSGGWSSGEEYRIDNVRFTATIEPVIIISDVTVDEGAGTATFTATHTGQGVLLPFTVNYNTVAVSATDGTDYNAISGTMFFNGSVGDSETLVVNILEDNLYEFSEVFEIQMTFSTNPSVNIADRGVGTITDNEVVLGNTPLTLFQEYDGYMDYATAAGTLRTQPNTVDACSYTNSSSNTLTSNIPAGATIERAILYWSNSGQMDPLVTFEGTSIDAELVYRTTIIGLEFHNHYADVTSLVQSIPDPSTNVFDFSDLTIDNSGSYCGSAVTLGGWALMVFYSAPGLPASTINLYQGFDGNQYSSSSFTLSGFYAIGSIGSKTTVLSWEGDQTLANSESLAFNTPLTGNNLLTGDGDNTTGSNPFNSTNYDNVGVPSTNNPNLHGVDLDTYDVSSFILPGETSATTVVNVGQDFVMMNAVVLKVPSNIIVGNVFEDVNYAGGTGRNRVAAGNVPIPGVTVELYDNTGTLVQTSTTNAAGQYDFAGMQNGTYTVRVVNSSVRSTRPGGAGCASCLPVQTFKSDYLASTVVTNANLIGGNDPSATDPAAGTLTGAQSTGTVTINNEGAVGLDFGFNFNTIVNTNEGGQGSLEQFIVNSNNLGETGLDIEANALFDPAAGEDLTVFMIPPAGDALGRAVDANYASGIFSINISTGNLSAITGNATHIDGRTQTAYSGDTNSGTVGSGGSAVGVSATVLPDYLRPEIQLYRPGGEVLINQGSNVVIRNLAIYANDKSAVLMEQGSLTIANNLLGVNAAGLNSGALLTGIDVKDGTTVIDGNYIATNEDQGILVDGGTSTIIRNNHITGNGLSCQPGIELKDGNGILIQYNLIENSGGYGIDGSSISSPVTIDENNITASGNAGGGCLAGILLEDDDAAITGNNIYENAGAGLILARTSSGNLISRNSFYANGTLIDALGIDFEDDGVSYNDNGDGDNGPNGLLNFPIIESAFISAGDLHIKGWARPGSIVEVFLTDVQEGSASSGDNALGNSVDYGEGQTYIGTIIEGSGSDLDSGTSSYSDVDGNTDNTNRFHFQIPVPPSVLVGDLITATATLGGSTSEFAPMSIIKIQTIITNRRITYRVNPN